MKFCKKKCNQLLQETSGMTKIGKSGKLKMAAAAILNSVYRL